MLTPLAATCAMTSTRVFRSATRKVFRCRVLLRVPRRAFASEPCKFAHRRSSLLFLGAPGVGKGTFGKRIAPYFNAQLMTSSDLLRDAAKNQIEGTSKDSNPENGKYILDCMKKGQLVSDDIVIPIVIDFLRNVPDSFIFDGFPRTLAQASRLQREYPLDLGIHFKLPHHILVDKILGRRICSNKTCGAGYNVSEINEGDIIMPSMSPKVEGICDKCSSELVKREDDTEEIIEQRMKTFYEMNNPIVGFYKEIGLLLEFDVKKGIDDVPEILDQIQRRLADEWDCTI